jgi:hypothetical protein
VAVDYPDDAPQANVQVGGSCRRSRNRHGRAGGRIVAPVEEICRRDSDGRVQGGRPWIGRSQCWWDAQMPEDTTDGWREMADDGRVQRPCSAANGVGANNSSGKAPEKQNKRSKSPRFNMPGVNFKENGCAKLRNTGKKLRVVQKYFMKPAMGYFDLTDQARHQRIFSLKNDGPKRSIRTAISAWKSVEDVCSHHQIAKGAHSLRSNHGSAHLI